jgi:carboxymethylenebutenolidase
MNDTDIGAVLDEHLRSEFETRDLEATMATMSPEPYLYHVPTQTGGVGYEAVKRFYAEDFIPAWPDDTKTIPISRTVSGDQVVDELVLSFTHDREMPYALPGVAPTGRKVELAHAVVVGFEGGKVHHEHIYWDQASLLVQIGLLDPATVPAIGVEQARRLLELAGG